MVLAATDLKVVPGALAVAALDLRHHHHDAERVPHATANSGDGQRDIVDELVLHRGRDFAGLRLQWRGRCSDFYSPPKRPAFQRGVPPDIFLSPGTQPRGGENL